MKKILKGLTNTRQIGYKLGGVLEKVKQNEKLRKLYYISEHFSSTSLKDNLQTFSPTILWKHPGS